MSSANDLLDALKQELKTSNMTYADLARAIGMSESSVKRVFSQRETSLSRIDEMCRALKLDFAELARRVADSQPLLDVLTPEQESALTRDRGLLLVGICCLSQWTFDQMIGTYNFTPAQCVKHLTTLDRLGIIELKPLNRYRLKLSKTFRWRPGGTVMRYFREHVLPDYFNGHFDRPDESVMLVHGSVASSMASVFTDKLHRLAQDFAQQHLADQRLPEREREGYTLILSMRRWEFSAFTAFRRKP